MLPYDLSDAKLFAAVCRNGSFLGSDDALHLVMSDAFTSFGSTKDFVAGFFGCARDGEKKYRADV
jgi:hypothetical protein